MATSHRQGARLEKPADYLELCATLASEELKNDPIDELTDAEIDARIATLVARRADGGGAQGSDTGAGAAGKRRRALAPSIEHSRRGRPSSPGRPYALRRRRRQSRQAGIHQREPSTKMHTMDIRRGTEIWIVKLPRTLQAIRA